MKNYILLFMLFGLLLSSCINQSKPNTTESISSESSKIPTEIIEIINAHGGIDAWKKQKSMEFTLLKDEKFENHQVDLLNRKVLIKSPDWNIGFDGKEVWITPDKEAFGKGSARFYHNLYFYFLAMPYMMLDEGINYEIIPKAELNNNTYQAVKITFNAGVGDAPEDIYIGYFNTETKLLEILVYTVTYYSREASTDYNALIYSNWTESNGLKIAQTMTAYKMVDGVFGDFKFKREFSEISLSENGIDNAIFEMPSGAEIDSLKIN